MVRAGRSTERASLIYQHSDLERQREVAAGLDQLVRAGLKRRKPGIWHGYDTRYLGPDSKEAPGRWPGAFSWSG